MTTAMMAIDGLFDLMHVDARQYLFSRGSCAQVSRSVGRVDGYHLITDIFWPKIWARVVTGIDQQCGILSMTCTNAKVYRLINSSRPVLIHT